MLPEGQFQQRKLTAVLSGTVEVVGVAIGIVVVFDVLVLLQLTLENALLGQAAVNEVVGELVNEL